MTMKKINYIIAIVCIVLASLFIYQAKDIPSPANIYPKTVLAVIAILGLLLIIQNKIRSNEQDSLMPFKDTRWLVIIGTIAGTAAYIWLISTVGFYVTSFFFLIIATYFLSGEKFCIKTLTHLTVMSTIVVAIVYFGFHVFLKVPTPTGIFF